MTNLEPHDQRHLEAAQGWFELGNYLASSDEFVFRLVQGIEFEAEEVGVA